MNFSDIFKKSFIEGFANTTFTTGTILSSILVTLVLSMFIFFVYRYVTRKTFYSTSFNISLVALAVITSSVILTIQSSIVVSLGMVGALSIVRFRTAIKDPMDLVFLFWSISVGIICGAGLAVIAVIMSLIIAVGILVLQKLPIMKPAMILVVNSTAECEKAILEEVKTATKHYTVKSRNLTPDALDMIIEMRVANDSDLLHKVCAIEGVQSATMMSHDGDITV